MIKLIKKLLSLPRLWKAMSNFEGAWDLTSSDRDDEAERLFAEGEALMKKLPYQYQIMKGYIKFKLEKREESAIIFKSALKAISADRDLSEDDALYLRAYISGPLKVYYQNGIGDIGGEDLTDINAISIEKNIKID